MDDAPQELDVEVLRAQLVEIETALWHSELMGEFDSTLALSLLQSDLQLKLQFEIDRRLALSISAAVESDWQCIRTLQALDADVLMDTQYATHVAELGDAAHDLSDDDDESAVSYSDDDRMMDWLRMWNIVGDGAGYNNVQGSSRPEGECAICLERRVLTDLVKTPCKHKLCGQCVSHMFERATDDESFYPPRCYGRKIPLAMAEPFMSIAAYQAFTSRIEEWETKKRIYCANERCRRFVRPRDIGQDLASCRACEMETCIFCLGLAHRGDCPQDHALQSLLRTAELQKWRRCQSCNRLVELLVGCNHITCHCGHHFCYVCGARWQTCSCPVWHEPNLFHQPIRLPNYQPH